ncbi:MAG: sulfurtransferase [Saprospiraceae bacterium]
MNNSLVNTQWLSDHIDDPNLIILDASSSQNKSGLQSHYSDICIKHARSISLKSTFSAQSTEMPNTLLSPDSFQKEARTLGINNNNNIVVYDNLGIYTSPRVWWMFKAMGLNNIAVLDGGLPQWVKDGYHTVAINNDTYSEGNFTVKPDTSLVKSMQDILENINYISATVLDARSYGRFCGTAPEPRKGLISGHIPNSRSLPFKDVLNGIKMKPKEELLEIFTTRGIQGENLIFTCGSGLTACITYLAADLALKNKKAIYDGSWTEWSQKQEGLISKK